MLAVRHHDDDIYTHTDTYTHKQIYKPTYTHTHIHIHPGAVEYVDCISADV